MLNCQTVQTDFHSWRWSLAPVCCLLLSCFVFLYFVYHALNHPMNKYVPPQHPSYFWICNIYLHWNEISHKAYMNRRHANIRKYWELNVRVYMAQEVLKRQFWAAALKKLTATFGKWRMTVGWTIIQITWWRLVKLCRESLQLKLYDVDRKPVAWHQLNNSHDWLLNVNFTSLILVFIQLLNFSETQCISMHLSTS